MKVEKVTFQTTYNIGPFLNTKVGFEATVDQQTIGVNGGSIRGEEPGEVLSKLRILADEWHKKEYPHLYQKGGPLPPPVSQTTPGPSVMETIDYKQVELWEAEIDDCITLEQLEQWVKDHPTFPGKLLSFINERRNALKKIYND